jgi:hypothetical protein
MRTDQSRAFANVRVFLNFPQPLITKFVSSTLPSHTPHWVIDTTPHPHNHPSRMQIGCRHLKSSTLLPHTTTTTTTLSSKSGTGKAAAACWWRFCKWFFFFVFFLTLLMIYVVYRLYLCIEGVRRMGMGSGGENGPKRHQTCRLGPRYVFFFAFFAFFMLTNNLYHI